MKVHSAMPGGATLHALVADSIRSDPHLPGPKEGEGSCSNFCLHHIAL